MWARRRRKLGASLIATLMLWICLLMSSAFAEEATESVKESAETQQSEETTPTESAEQTAAIEPLSETAPTESSAPTEPSQEMLMPQTPVEPTALNDAVDNTVEQKEGESPKLQPVSLTLLQPIEPSTAPTAPAIAPIPPSIAIPDAANGNNKQPPASLAPKPVAHGYTGLIVNCKGLGLKSAMSPVIKDANGAPVYGHKNINPDFVVAYGMVNYADNINSNDTVRAGNNPLIIMALSVTDHNSNPVISVDDANRVLAENQVTGFLDKCLVVLLW